jgi:hypothetical protein
MPSSLYSRLQGMVEMPKTEVYRLRLTPEDRAKLQLLAHSAGLVASEYLRHVIRNGPDHPRCSRVKQHRVVHREAYHAPSVPQYDASLPLCERCRRLGFNGCQNCRYAPPIKRRKDRRLERQFPTSMPGKPPEGSEG